MYERLYCVYILTNPVHTVLYTGMSGNIARRIYEHQNKLVPGFTSRYNCIKLVYIDSTNDVMSALEREKEIKGWTRAKKVALIESLNPDWEDLSKTLET